LGASLVSCVTTAGKAKHVDLQVRSASQVTALAFTLQIKGARAELIKDDCELVISQSGRMHDWYLPLSSKSKLQVFALPEAKYVPKALVCAGGTRTYEISKWGDKIQVYSGKIGYAGEIEINVQTPEHVVIGLMTGSHSTQQELKTAMDQAHLQAQNNFVSVWTAKPITSRMLQEKPYSGIEYTWKSAGEIGDRGRLLDSARDCERDEVQRNRVLYGRVKLSALYLKGKFANTTIGDVANTYSDEFISCLQEGLKSFSVKTSEPVVITVDL
jgi:hypothetical protein